MGPAPAEGGRIRGPWHDGGAFLGRAQPRLVMAAAGERVPFGPGEALFAAAGVAHRFEGFSDDFATRVVFYGPPGGEHP